MLLEFPLAYPNNVIVPTVPRCSFNFCQLFLITATWHVDGQGGTPLACLIPTFPPLPLRRVSIAHPISQTVSMSNHAKCPSLKFTHNSSHITNWSPYWYISETIFEWTPAICCTKNNFLQSTFTMFLLLHGLTRTFKQFKDQSHIISW